MNEFLFGKSKNKVHFISLTAILLALTIALQFLSSLLNQQLVTGSVVNMMLLVNTIFVGLSGGIVVALVTPFIGLLIGLAQNILLVPFIALGNILYVVSFMLLKKALEKINTSKEVIKVITMIFAIIIASLVKFCFMYFVALKLLLPVIMPKVPEALNVMFGITQLFTALIGGTLFIVISRVIKRIKFKN